ncbi:galanin receptor type 1 [Amia ocellicauda]|uniref:galanin receptor type 1 n=1 Tax=Amia ocellicauda TaxID=2972642 RepID=UPI003464D876
MSYSNSSCVENGTAYPEETNMDVNISQIVVPVLDALILATGVVGHSLVVLILTRRRSSSQRRHGTDTLLLTLSVADLLQLACLPFNTAAIAMGRWPFGIVLCKMISFLGVACSSTSVFTLAALAVSRYLTVVYPTWAYRSWLNRHSWVTVAALWLPTVALASPQFVYRTVRSGSAVYCFAFLSDVSQLVYGAALFLFGFVVPLAIIVVMYGRLYSFLRRTRQAGHAPQLERYQSQVTRTSALLVLVFTVCWLPSYVLMFSLVGYTFSEHSYHAFPIFARLLACSSTVTNPILYVFISGKFRKDLASLAGRGRGCGCCGCPEWGRDTVNPLNSVELRSPPAIGTRSLCPPASP